MPMTLGQEFGAYAVTIDDGVRHLEQASATELLKVNMGATAIGTGIQQPFRLCRALHATPRGN